MQNKFTRRDKYFLPILILLLVNLAISIFHLIVTQFHGKRHVLINEPEELPTSEKQAKVLTTHEVNESFVSSVITHNIEAPPLTLGPQRLHYQYAVAIPQAYLTLLSVLQGIVFGGLLFNILNITLPHDVSLTNFFLFSLQQYLYLPYIISSFLILIIWNQFVNAILFLAWPFTVFQASIMFLMSLIEVLTFAHINYFPGWLFGLGCIGLTGGSIRLHNIRLHSEDVHGWSSPLDQVTVFSKGSELHNGILYICLGFIVLLISLSLNTLIEWSKMISPRFSLLIPWFIITILTIFLSTILFISAKEYPKFVDTIIKSSDLLMSSRGVLSYKKLDESENLSK